MKAKFNGTWPRIKDRRKQILEKLQLTSEPVISFASCPNAVQLFREILMVKWVNSLSKI